ncbi:hypothetical protein [Spirillospora sp. NPDC047279]|uniref:hypothetical protein n=1 Tax=Spirillospora sp. NPDC047279 TaxID=3155478 RepID=UPI0033E1053C
MTNEMLKDAIGKLADEARPVDDMAERALRRMDARRRNVRLTGVVLAITAAVAVPSVLFGSGGEGASPDVAVKPKPHPLPSDTPAEAKITKGCMRGGAPVGQMAEQRADLGRASDFRLLVSQKVGGREFVAVVGSELGFVICVGGGRIGNVNPPVLEAWKGGRGFSERLKLDRATSSTTTDGSWPAKLHLLAFGRAKPGVARVVVTWSDGHRATATIENGYFLARRPSRVVETRVPGDTDMDAVGGSDPDVTVTTVVGHDASGRAVGELTPR